MDLKIGGSLLLQRIRETEWIVETGLFLLMMLGLIAALLQRRSRAVKTLSQVHRATRANWKRRLVESYIVSNRDAVRVDGPPTGGPDVKKLFGNRLLVLKAPAAGGEKGVLLVMFTEMVRLLHISMDLPKLLQDYTLVLEPSWSGYCAPEFLQFMRYEERVFVLAAEANDFAFIQRLNSNVVPLDFGPCDWVDPRVAEPFLAEPKEFDILMNSNWAGWKRHYMLFRMLAKAKRKFRVALIGVKWAGRTSADIESLADFYGVQEQITLMERIPYEKVMEITCKSRVSILLSLKEGSNRAIAESIFCNVPVVVLSSHVGGIRKNVVPQTGLLTDERKLESTITELLSGSLCPRDWGIEYISCFKSSSKLNAALRENASRTGKPWTQDIAGRSSSPESKYISDDDAKRLQIWNQGLDIYLKTE